MGSFLFSEINGTVIGKTDDSALNSGLLYGFSTRLGGVSKGSLASLNLGVNRPDSKENLIENYRIFCDSIGVDYNNVVLPRQVHSDIIFPVTAKDRGTRLVKESNLPDCDGLITTDKETVLGIFYADCTPVLLFDTKVKCLCLVHCGWRGTVKGFAETGIITMINDYGCNPQNIHGVIGPCIGSCCFEVGEEVKKEFERVLIGKYIRPGKTEGKYFADLKGANREFLLRGGLAEENITISEECTMCKTDKYFSHRGCGGDTGRMAVLAQIKN